MIDKVIIKVKGGNGGNGAVSFRKEKFVPFGGPDGGNGGRGGCIYLVVEPGMTTFASYKYKTSFQAENGRNGSGSKKTGRRGKDLYLNVPKGTYVRLEEEEDSEKLIKALMQDGEKFLLVRGGRGGRGNHSFANARERVPRIAETGEEGEEREIILELKLLADVAIIGYPSCGKSTLLQQATEAKPKVGAYPFTTVEPVLGVVQKRSCRYTMAEIPGLIKGAHMGRGLGDEFLQHAQRSRLILHLVDGQELDLKARIEEINEELHLFDPEFLKKPQLIVVNKTDLPDVREGQPESRLLLEPLGYPVYFISGATGEGVEALLEDIGEMLTHIPEEKAPDVEALAPQQRARQVLVERQGEVFVVHAPSAERLVKMTDMGHLQARQQFMRRLERLGVNDALEKAGVKPGDTVRLGKAEFEWY